MSDRKIHHSSFILQHGWIFVNITREDSRWVFHGVGSRWRRENRVTEMHDFPSVVTVSRLTADWSMNHQSTLSWQSMELTLTWQCAYCSVNPFWVWVVYTVVRRLRPRSRNGRPVLSIPALHFSWNLSCLPLLSEPSVSLMKEGGGGEGSVH